MADGRRPGKGDMYFFARSSTAREGHGLNEDRPGADVAARVHVVADCDQSAEHVLEVAGDGDFLDQVLDRAVLHTKAGGADSAG